MCLYLIIQPQNTCQGGKAERGRDKFTGRVGDVNIPLFVMNKTNRREISKNIENLNNAINQLDLISIFEAKHPTIEKYTFFSVARRTFTNPDHMLGCKTWLIKFKRIATFL